MLTQERLKESYGYQDGFLTREGTQVVNTPRNDGYVRLEIDSVTHYMHRVIWLWHHGYLPENNLDHINRNRSDNRIENLREVSQMCNLRNANMTSRNTSGVTGVGWAKNRNKWSAYIKINGKLHRLGNHADFTEAVAHRLAAEQAENWSVCESSSPAYKHIKEIPMPEKKEKTTKLYYLHDVDTSSGLAPTAYGIELSLDDKGNYFANVPAERAKTELTRTSKAFTKTLKKVDKE